ncbi:MAG: hypothetical protein LBR41_01410 [Rickettsiales bacterium]|jgi:hypothetical protein|nr:hypothetical protein [Rickettsiales bacterium]
MNINELLSWLKNNGGTALPAADIRDIQLANNTLQTMKCPMLPNTLIELYQNAGAIFVQDSHIFGPNAARADGRLYEIPSITEINRTMDGVLMFRGTLIFGRNGLFYFTANTDGTANMLDITTGAIAKKYCDVNAAIYDCLAGGRA